MSITVFSKLSLMKFLLLALLAITAVPSMANDDIDKQPLSQQVQQALNSFIALYDKKVNFDGQFPYDIAKHNNDIETGYSRKHPENTDPNKVLEFKLSANQQMLEYLQTMPADEIEEFRQTLAGAVKRKQEDKQYQQQKKKEAAEYREQQRIAKSLPTYDRDHFYQTEQEFFQQYNKRINFDNQIPSRYFGYDKEHEHQQIKAQLADATSAKQNKAIYHRAERNVIIFISRLNKMADEEIDQFRTGTLALINHNTLVDEQRKLHGELEQLTAVLTDFDNQREELISNVPQCSYDETDCLNEQRDIQQTLNTLKRDFDRKRTQYENKRQRLKEIERQFK